MRQQVSGLGACCLGRRLHVCKISIFLALVVVGRTAMHGCSKLLQVVGSLTDMAELWRIPITATCYSAIYTPDTTGFQFTLLCQH